MSGFIAACITSIPGVIVLVVMIFKIKKSYRFVDVVLGTRNKGDIVYWANRAMVEKNQFVEVNDILRNKQFEELEISEYQDRTRAFVKIQDGCNRFCTFCLIPFARGAVCSKDPKKVIEEVKTLDETISAVEDLGFKALAMRDELTVIILCHSETISDDNGFVRTRVKTNGRKLEKLVLESKMNTVIWAVRQDGKYKFILSADGSTCKVPIGAFEETEIDNDITKVIDALKDF